ncbi:MAG: hypothetical protein ACREU3_07670 [Steroidobacteraceae bacterium]
MSARKANVKQRRRIGAQDFADMWANFPKLGRSDRAAGIVLGRLRRAKPVMSKEQMERIEAGIMQGQDGVSRRIALAVLTAPGARLLNQIKRDRDTAMATAWAECCIEEAIPRVEYVLGWMKEAQARLLFTLAVRADMTELMEQARKPQEDETGASQRSQAALRLVVDNTRGVRP